MDFILPKGVRDYSAEESKFREWIREEIKNVYQLYGFQPFEPPCLEKIKTLTAKSGEGIEGEIFRIENSDIGLRFDLTVPFARYIATSPLPKPIKRYWIGKVWRREEPQRMRLREFWQADADIIGLESYFAEVELILMANRALKQLGLDVYFLLNSRRLVDKWLEKRGISNKERVMRIIDKLDKIGMDGVGRELEMNGIDTDLLKDINLSLSECAEFDKKEGKKLENIINIAKEFGVDVRFSFSLMRGLGYYTGPVFEIKTKGEQASVGGGGRYDGLLNIYGIGAKAVGISIGVERVFQLLWKTKKTFERDKIFVLSLDAESDAYGLEIAEMFRKFIPINFIPHGKRLNKLLKYVDENDGRLAIIVGKCEKEEKTIVIRDMETKEIKKVSVEKIME
jgi:histidyl-tRNA synthetase